ncbi:hypothetical protein [Agarivorans sp. Z349TD_8]|uniref:hypothetical protein n=1 Tax=Agarivorans sp. Z349TD_8 TaxID=3421434 RepID=UPI003D7DDBDC
MQTTTLQQDDLENIEANTSQIIAISHLALTEQITELPAEDLTHLFRLISDLGQEILAHVTKATSAS